MTKPCENHPVRAATHSVEAPAPPRTVYLCSPCAALLRSARIESQVEIRELIR